MTPSPTIPAKTSEMQERIARAIYEGTPRNCPWSALSLHKKQKHRAEALAVMKAMREPNMRMLAAAQTAWRGDPEKKTSTLWRAMLDAEISIAEGGKDGQ